MSESAERDHGDRAGEANRIAGEKCRRVLVVDDNEDMAEGLRELLLLGGNLEVEVANNGATAIRSAVRFHPDLVLCDIGLPDMDGYEVARALRSNPKLSGIRIVALTGYARKEDTDRCARAGFDGHLAKPLTPEQLSWLLGPLSSLPND